MSSFLLTGRRGFATSGSVFDVNVLYSLLPDGFHKVISVEQGGLRLDRDEMEFAHAYFMQGNEDALEYIKRKVRK